MWLCMCICLLIFATTPVVPSANVTDLQSSVSRPRVRRQESNKCVLPPYPAEGIYRVLNDYSARPGDSRENYRVSVACRQGYGFPNDDRYLIDVFCIDGEWSQPMPKCIRYCKLEPDPSVRYRCSVPGVGYKDCAQYVPPGTIVDPVCNKPLYYSTDSLKYMKCINGFWDYIAKCKPECGRVTPEGEQLVVGGERVERGELPWHAGIYTKTTYPFMQICGGSLVSNKVVISAAHCFWKDKEKKLPASQFAVAVGKVYRRWYTNKDFDVQKSDVKEIKLPILFYGGLTNYQDDIAVVIVTTPFVYKPHVRPVCLNFDSNFEKRQLQEGKLGKVAGWGLQGPKGMASPVLLVVQLPYITLETCLNTIPETFREYITGDKFCAGYTNGTTLCKGDSGGGLAILANTELDVARYYLRGVVSAAPSSDTQDLCNTNTYTTFTKIIKHEDFIIETMASTDTSCPSYLFQCGDGTCIDRAFECNGKQECEDGSDEAKSLCETILNKTGFQLASGPVPASTYKCVEYMKEQDKVEECCWAANDSRPLEIGHRAARRGELPWHVGIYAKTRKPFKLICAGNIISEKVILTAASCFRDGSAPSFYAVVAGNLYASWNDGNDTDTQKSDVKDIRIPDKYEEIGDVFTGNIAILTLVTPITFTYYVRAACVTFHEYSPPNLMRTAAWGVSPSESSLQELNTVDMAHLGTCNVTIPGSLQSDKICTRFNRDRRSFQSLPGSGLILEKTKNGEKQYGLYAILSDVITCQDCIEEVDNYFMYTQLLPYLTFIFSAEIY